MIDLDRLDEGITRALTEEVRRLRGVVPEWVGPRPEREAPTPPPVVADAEPWDDELWAEAGFEPGAATEPEPAPATEPEPALVIEAEPEPPVVTAVAAPPKPAPPPKRFDVTFERRPAAAPRRGPVAAAPRPQPQPAPTPIPAGEDRVAALMMQGRVAEADEEIARAGTPMEWRIMRALLDGRRNEASASLRLVTKLGRGDRFWFQRFWVALEWGEKAEQGEVLDHCREQAYRYGETQWRGALSLQLARLGRQDEAARELNTTVQGLDSWPDDRNRVDIITNLIEAAYLLGDAAAAADLATRLHTSAARSPVVVVGPGWVCKGSLARYEALAAAAGGQWKRADERFAAAADAHDDLGAQPLLARTLIEWGNAVQAHDHSRGHRYIEHGVSIADRLHLTGVANLTRSAAMAS